MIICAAKPQFLSSERWLIITRVQLSKNLLITYVLVYIFWAGQSTVASNFFFVINIFCEFEI